MNDAAMGTTPAVVVVLRYGYALENIRLVKFKFVDTPPSLTFISEISGKTIPDSGPLI